MTVGLTLGKFAPLHRGHQLVIETALEEMEHVIVLIYPAVESDTPLTVRADWIRTLYPQVEVIEAWLGPTQVGYTPELTESHDAYLREITKGKGVTHFYSSERYGEHVSIALDACDRRVDPERAVVSVSATAIRTDPFGHRQFLHPLVYRDLITTIAFVGAPSTGKTTLARSLAAHYETVWMPEYGREYWENHQIDRRLTLEELATIGVEHRRREDALLLDADRMLFVDTEAMITRIFSLHYHGQCLPALERMAAESRDRYDLFFLCENDFPFADTPDRSGEANQILFQQWIRDDLDRRKIPYVTLSGSIEERMGNVAAVLTRFRKYDSLVDAFWNNGL